MSQQHFKGSADQRVLPVQPSAYVLAQSSTSGLPLVVTRHTEAKHNTQNGVTFHILLLSINHKGFEKFGSFNRLPQSLNHKTYKI